jgi:hypothetical protein
VNPLSIATSGIKVVRLVCDRGPGEWSIALLRNSANQEYFGLRWNGEEDENGYPTSRGKPVWFSLPGEISEVLVPHFTEAK